MFAVAQRNWCSTHTTMNFSPLFRNMLIKSIPKKVVGEKKKNAVVPPGAKQKTLLRRLRVCVFAY